MKMIKLPIHGIELSIDDENPSGGSINSLDLYETCPKCGEHDCIWSCDESHIGEVESEDDVGGRLAFNGVVNGVMSMILAHACAGIDIESQAYLNGIETALQAAGGNL